MDADTAFAFFNDQRIKQLFESLAAGVLFHKPADPVEFLHTALGQYASQPARDRHLSLDTFMDANVSLRSGTLPALGTPARAAQTHQKHEAVNATLVALSPQTLASSNSSSARSRGSSPQMMMDFQVHEHDRIDFSGVPPSPPALVAVGLASDRNGVGMEDESLAAVLDGGHPLVAFLGVFDGHSTNRKAGRAAAMMARNNLLSLFLREFDSFQRSPHVKFDASAVFARIFAEVETTMEQYGEQYHYAGTTATVVAVMRGDSSQELQLHVANVGDSSAIIGSGLDYRVITQAHSSEDAEEVARCSRAGAFVTDNFLGKRVNGLLVTRSIGDLKCEGTINEPATRTLQRAAHCGETLILATDGLWGLMHPREAMQLASKARESGLSSEQTAQFLLQEALAHQDSGMSSSAQSGNTPHKDNITVLVAHL